MYKESNLALRQSGRWHALVVPHPVSDGGAQHVGARQEDFRIHDSRNEDLLRS
jgi:hypothetical protein